MNDQIQLPDGGTGRKAKWILAVFAVIAGFLLLVEHRAHVLPYLPWLLLAACPLMHLLMHHGGHHHEGVHRAPTLEANTRGEVRHD